MSTVRSLCSVRRQHVVRRGGIGYLNSLATTTTAHTIDTYTVTNLHQRQTLGNKKRCACVFDLCSVLYTLTSRDRILVVSDLQLIFQDISDFSDKDPSKNGFSCVQQLIQKELFFAHCY